MSTDYLLGYGGSSEDEFISTMPLQLIKKNLDTNNAVLLGPDVKGKVVAREVPPEAMDAVNILIDGFKKEK